MSQRVKKPGKLDDNHGKRRRRRPSGSDGEEDGTRSGSNSGGNSSFPSIGGMWTPRHLNDLKVSSIYNRNSAEAPAELYRKDLISAMKLADSEPLTPEEYWLITDPWKQEWEKGVQVPVNPESLPEPEVVVISPVNERSHDFRLPKKKYIRVTHDDFFNPDYHQLVSTAARAEKVCSYDLDDIDASWLSCANSDRGMQTLPVISEFLMEQVIEELELQCWEQVQTILKSQEGLGIEYDENVICDVCRSPESEEGNEMVFCDACNICVHQACYGITTIPSGSWLCRTCTLGIRPSCVLCPNMGGAMKATRSGQKWAHVACAIWIPEVSIGSVEKMEPITKISAIPQSRWSLICVLCKDKVGACIQCSVKTCKTAYHVTCAFKSGLEMKPIIVDENAEDGIKLRSYCQKHSVNTKKDKSAHSGSEEDGEKKKARAMTAEERNQARAEKLQQIESEFYKYVRLKDVSQNLAVDMDIVLLIYNYWKLKRKSLNNRPLVPPRPETTQLLTQQQEQDLEQMKMFVQLRQDLERVRNLCYMVSRREKLSRTYFRLREQTFQKQVAILSDKSMDIATLAPQERCAILDANHGTSIYDQIYSCDKAEVALKDYDTLVSLIAGEDRKDKLINGVIKPKKSSAAGGLGTYINSGSNSFKKQFVNGARKKNLMGESCSSLSESDASVNDNPVATTRKLKLGHGSSGRKPLSYLFDSDSSADGASLNSNSKGVADLNKKQKGKTSALRRAQKLDKKSSTSDSDELELPVPKVAGLGKSDAPIYSDSDTDASLKKRSGSPVATKAAVKEFTRKSNKKDVQRGAMSVGPKAARTGPAKKVGAKGRKKKGPEPTEMIVPQREAAKKATESIRTVKQRKDFGNADGNPENSLAPASPSKYNEDEREAIEKSTFEKFKDIAAASVQDKLRGVKKSEKSKGSEFKKGAHKKGVRLDIVPKDEEEDQNLEFRDQYEFDGSNDGSSKHVPTFVPQRQAAKKAAEHIRSGLSNIVAARLIIEDEMEATRKKSKGDKTVGSKKPLDTSPLPPASGSKRPNKTRGKSPFQDDLVDATINEELDNSGPKSRAKKRTLSKGEDNKGVGKGGRRDSMSTASAETSGKDRQADWPFLFQGSQSACRQSRERSSSSSSSSSSGSSSTDSSSTSRSSASSSPASAAPRKTSTLSTTYPTSSPIASISATARGPSRKLKTSDRSPDSGPRNETTPGKKPAPKSRRSSKLRPGGASASSAHSIPTDSRPSKQHSSDQPSDDEHRTRQHKFSTSSSSSESGRCSPSPSSARVSQKNNKSPEEKRKRGKREPSGLKEKAKNLFSSSKCEASSLTSKSNAKPPTRTAAKTVVCSSRQVTGVLDLSSDSENDDKLSPTRNTAGKGRGKELPSQSPSITPSDSKTLRSATKSKKKGVNNLSESESELADEKENSCRTPAVSTIESPSTNSRSRNQKPGVTSSAACILSPLTPSSENKEKEHGSGTRSSDVEPDAKRARLESGTSGSQTQVTTTSTNSGTPSYSSLSMGGNIHGKSLFSPRGGHETDLADFDTELYDLARSVSADYSQCDEEVGASASQPFSFSQTFLNREDTGEDSAQATLNLVEKLRLQHARKSGCPRSSMDGSDMSLEDPDAPSKSSALVETSSVHGDEDGRNSSTKTVSITHAMSPERDKAAQDERWVPPSHSEQGDLESDGNKGARQRRQSQLKSLSSPNSHSIMSPNERESLYDVRKAQIGKADLASQRLHSHENQDTGKSDAITLQISERKMANDGQKDNSHPLSISIGSPTPSPVTTSPGVKMTHGVQSMLYPTGNSATGFQVPPSHPPFIYPITGAPSIQNMVNSLTSVAPNSPRSAFFRNQTPIPNMSQHTPTSSLSPGYPRQNFPGSQHFLHGKQSTKENAVASSPKVINQRRPSEYLEENVVSDSIVTSGMPPLAKPSIASPSMILAANNVKNITPPAPPQSTVAQIIENVVNNHANNSSLVAQEILNAMLNIGGPSSQSTLSAELSKQKSTGRNISTDMAKPNIHSTIGLTEGNAIDIQTHSMKMMQSPPGHTRESDFELNSKVKGDILTSKTSGSPRGRGRRATTPRGPPKNDKILTNCETNGVKAKGQRERKSNNSTSPARAKASAPRRGGGRGKGRGKGLVATRKDLAGTVYDIDFDEFEENVDEKMDLRMLRERRKSSDVHFESKTCKSETSESPSDQRLISLEMASPKSRETETLRIVVNQKSLSQASVVNENSVPLLQTALPGPVDMRTYNAGSVTTRELSEDVRSGKTEYLSRKDTRITDISSIFSSGSEKGSMNEIEELDETLEALSSSKAPPNYSLSKGIHAHSHTFMDSISMRHPTDIPPEVRNAFTSRTDTFMDSNNTDFSRNQLKVKIKGPFLDANYGSHSIVGDPSTGVQHYPNSFHHPAGPSQIVNVPATNTSNLRRMRKKELLRQYWNQDMNMDGSSCGPSHDAEIPHSSMVHPINRSVITIPKAVASMAIIPTKDDYRLESLPNSNDPLSTNPVGLLKDMGSVGSVPEKRKRSRGMREMAALGILTCDSPRERRRDRADSNLSSSSFSGEMMGKKRGKTNKRPIRSTFIPPTLVDSDPSTGDKKINVSKLPAIPSTSSTSAMSTVVTAVNHPTPKLKIKFADLSKGSSVPSLSGTLANHVLSDSSDKEAPNKKAKGRPPKKRGISELTSAAPPSMEDLKRESMKFRELVMQDFAVEERKEILQLHGTRRHKKHKRKGGTASSETDDGVNPEVKVIADGTTKLILRFGKARAGGKGNAGGSDSSSETKVKDGDEPGPAKEMVEELGGENDSGFTGSSEGSSGSVSELTGASKEKLASATAPYTPLIKPEPNPSELNIIASVPETTSYLPTLNSTPVPCFPDISNDLSADVKPPIMESGSFQPSNDKIMPIRLKLSRCFEGYSLKNKPESCAGEGVPPTPPKQSEIPTEVR